MARTPEGKVKAAVKTLLDKRGVWYCMPIGTGFGSSGVPDFVCCWNGKFIGIETKAPGRLKSTTELQRIQQARIQAAGGISIVIDDVSTLEGVLNANTST